MRQPLRRGAVFAWAALTAIATAGPVSAQQSKDKGKERPKSLEKGTSKAERVSGVIIKVEESALAGDESPRGDSQKEASSAPRGKRLTINTSIPWSDWVRDQVTEAPGETPPKEAADKGETSIATKGHPKSVDTLVTVDLPADTKIETRFRSPTDEANEGATTPEGAAEADKDPADTSKKAKGKGKANAKGDRAVPRFDLANLKSGLFVDVEFQHETGRNRGRRVVVLRPVGGAIIPPAEAAPASKGGNP